MLVNLNNLYFDFIKKVLRDNFDVSFKMNIFTKGYIFLENNSPIGFILYDLIYDRAELNYIYVDDSYRNHGIASKMMDAMIKECSDCNLSNITLEVNVNNSAAISLYKKYKFEICALRKGYYNGQDGYLMIRK